MKIDRAARRCALQAMYQFDADEEADHSIVEGTLEGSGAEHSARSAGFALATKAWDAHERIDLDINVDFDVNVDVDVDVDIIIVLIADADVDDLDDVALKPFLADLFEADIARLKTEYEAEIAPALGRVAKRRRCDERRLRSDVHRRERL